MRIFYATFIVLHLLQYVKPFAKLSLLKNKLFFKTAANIKKLKLNCALPDFSGIPFPPQSKRIRTGKMPVRKISY